MNTWDVTMPDGTVATVHADACIVSDSGALMFLENIEVPEGKKIIVDAFAIGGWSYATLVYEGA